MDVLPGAPETIHHVAAALVHQSEQLQRDVQSLRRAAPESWKGAAADAFRSAEAESESALIAAAVNRESVSRLLSAYANFLDQLALQYDEVTHDIHRARRALTHNPLDAIAGFALTRLWSTQRGLMSQAQNAAIDTARQIMAIVEPDLGNEVGDWWNPFSWWEDDTVPHMDVNADTLDDTNWDPGYVQQGQLGDCYLLAAVMGYMDTEDGRQMLQDNVRWDENKDGYWVTLYSNGNPVDYFVSDVYGQGVNQQDGKTLWWENTSPNIVSLYESAMAQHITFDDMSDGGTTSSATEMISGRAADYDSTDYSTYSSDVETWSEALETGSSVVASTYNNDRTSLEDVEVRRNDGTIETTNIEIVGSHAYQISSIESDGSMWVRNPWGPGNSADGGGLIHLSPTQVRQTFAGVSYEEAS